MLSLKVAGQWLSRIGSYGPVTVEYGLHGLDAVSWSMDPGIEHPRLRGRSMIDVFDGGILIGNAILQEPGGTGEFVGRGVWRMAEDALAMTAAGALTTVPDEAIDGAVARGELSTGLLSSISATPWATETKPDMTVAQLLDGWSAEAGLRWRVEDNTKGFTVFVDPTTPRWVVPNLVAGRGLTPAEDEFYTHLVGYYVDSATSVSAVATVGSAESAAAFGRRTAVVDLNPKGPITAAEAESVLTGMFLLSGARMGWAEGLELGYGQITNRGGTPAPLSQIKAGQMVRLSGVIDTSRANRLPMYTDIVIGSSKYTDGSGTISLTPVGYAPRTLSDVLTVAMEGE